MKCALALLALLGVIGCDRVVYDPGITYHTRKVWRTESNLDYVFSWHNRDYGCGHIDRENNGWIYRASLVDWNHAGERGVRIEEPASNWNSLQDAEKFVEQWCRP